MSYFVLKLCLFSFMCYFQREENKPPENLETDMKSIVKYQRYCAVGLEMAYVGVVGDLAFRGKVLDSRCTDPLILTTPKYSLLFTHVCTSTLSP